MELTLRWPPLFEALLSLMARLGSDEAGHPHAADYIARLKNREEPALRELFERYRRRVERVLLRILGPDPEISDIVQDSFERAIEGVDRFRGEASSLGPWLSQIAVYTARDRLRRRKVRAWFSQPEPTEPHELASKVASPEVVEAMRRTYEVLDKLPTSERIMFALRFIDGMQLTEIAASTGTSLATVKRRLSKARERFERHARKDPYLHAWVTGGQR